MPRYVTTAQFCELTGTPPSTISVLRSRGLGAPARDGSKGGPRGIGAPAKKNSTRGRGNSDGWSLGQVLALSVSRWLRTKRVSPTAAAAVLDYFWNRSESWFEAQFKEGNTVVMFGAENAFPKLLHASIVKFDVEKEIGPLPDKYKHMRPQFLDVSLVWNRIKQEVAKFEDSSDQSEKAKA